MATDQPIPPIGLGRARGRWAGISAFLLFVGGYVALLAWFKQVDVYHTHFSDPGVLVLINNAFRVLFIFYLFWIVQAAGALLLRLLGAAEPEAVGTLDYLALTFFAGTGPWHVVLLAIGYANLLNLPAMMILTLPMVALAFRELRLVAPGLQRAFAAGFKERGGLFTAACVALGLVWGTLLLVKGLYPGGGQDYFVQYSPVYQAIVDRGSVWPNEVWWHYFYSKGAGLFFLGMLLTDALAPQLVIFCLLSVAGLVIFLFARRLAPGTGWPMAGVVLFFATYIYTPGWGEFGKLHEFNTAFVIAMLWMTAVALGDTGNMRRAWLAGVASTMTAAIIVNNMTAVFVAAVFSVLALAYACLGERRGFVCLAFAALAGALCSCNLLLNFVTSGLLSGWDPSFPYLWKFADIETLYRWGALPMSIILLNFYGAPGVPLVKSLNFVNFASRTYLLWPLLFGGLAMTAMAACARCRAAGTGSGSGSKPAPLPQAGDASARRRRWRVPLSDPALILLAAVMVFCALTATTGRGMSGSYFRAASFMVPVMIVAGIALWSVPLRHEAAASLRAAAGHPATPLAVLALCAVVLAGKTPINRDIVPLTTNALKHAAGMLSIDGAYTHQSSGHPIGPWGGIYPGARGAYGIVGPRVPVWSMHTETYCMLPDCKMRSYPHFLMGRSWDRVMWGTAEEGETALRAAGLNYFLFSRELLVRDPLFFSPLFSPDAIARHFGIRWTDGTTTLLTWSGPETRPLDETWLVEYRQATAASPWRLFGNARMKAIFERLHATPHPWRPVELPQARP